MPRLARSVFAGVPHHVTQRGNRREDVFFDDEDRKTYLKWLNEYAVEHGVEVVAYCLMTNHIHLILVPSTEDGLQKVMKPLHMRYAQRLNRARGQQGHVWQGRYFSSVLDGDYLRSCLRYVERNPVRARMVRKAENYAWSSARGHCGLVADPLLKTTKSSWRDAIADVKSWSQWLAEPDADEALLVLRRNTMMGLPCASGSFLKKLERLSGRSLHYRSPGRPRKEKSKSKETGSGKGR
jgi:putative transposase